MDILREADAEGYDKCPVCGQDALLVRNRGELMCHDCAIRGESEFKKCVRCGKQAPNGITTDKGPMCIDCIGGHVGAPGVMSPEARTKACGICGRHIDEVPLLFAGQHYHRECMLQHFRDTGCPKCKSRGLGKRPIRSDGRCSDSGCSWDFERMAAQAEKDAATAAVQGKTCKLCLGFNAMVASGLPLYPRDPEPATTTCSQCGQEVCDTHQAEMPKGNVLGIPTGRIFCSGSYTTRNCMSQFEDKVKCCANDCYTHDHDNIKGWDRLVDSGKCDKCGKFFCNVDHDRCPDCVGIPCDDCKQPTPQDELYALDVYGNTMLCSECHSSHHCSVCGEEMSEEEMSGIGYHKECAAEEGLISLCPVCGDVVGEDGVEMYEVDPENDLWHSKGVGRTKGRKALLCPGCAKGMDEASEQEMMKNRAWPPEGEIEQAAQEIEPKDHPSQGKFGFGDSA